MQLSFPQVEQELAFGPENLKIQAHEISKKIDNVSELLGIPELLKSDISALSYGQKKLVALASIFTFSPEIILLDEPGDGLSGQSIQNVIKCVLHYKNDKLVIITSTTHFFDDVTDIVITLS